MPIGPTASCLVYTASSSPPDLCAVLGTTPRKVVADREVLDRYADGLPDNDTVPWLKILQSWIRWARQVGPAIATIDDHFRAVQPTNTQPRCGDPYACTMSRIILVVNAGPEDNPISGSGSVNSGLKSPIMRDARAWSGARIAD